ncbi:hypothetical protein BDN72DRAFT_899278 [Pluteus cervinus]|uniref:Uncharacterized protein n=1 Tax=Pluteus cervinus TaxID=181527 RepID=A0ACD3AQ67_9AGAR|nr:hypothetical protein BDN72DRAFT_899278 [Pluteus cervinus]
MDQATSGGGQPNAVANTQRSGGLASRLIMTPAARMDALRRQRETRHRYNNEVQTTWTELTTMAEDIAKKHHKSVQRVQRDIHLAQPVQKRPKVNAWNAFCRETKEQRRSSGDTETGRSFLPHLVQQERENYKKLTPEEKQQLIEKHTQRRSVEATTRRVSGHTRAIDVASTMKHAREVFSNLQSRTGVEILVYAVPGTTDLPIKGSVWSTDGAKNFMEGTMKIDEQDLLGKMEGHAINGVYGTDPIFYFLNVIELKLGAADNHDQRKGVLREQVRQHILHGLRVITQNPTARMEYVHYWEKVVRRYHVVLEGWPDKLPFKNLSDCADSLYDINLLQDQMKNQLLSWKKLTEIEFDELDEIRQLDIAEGRVPGPKPRKVRSDRGQKRKQNDVVDSDNEHDDN